MQYGKQIRRLRPDRSRAKAKRRADPAAARNHPLQRDSDALSPDRPDPGPPAGPAPAPAPPTAIGAMPQAVLDAELQKGLDSLRTGVTYSPDEVDAALAESFGL